jgi:hypothetical protein
MSDQVAIAVLVEALTAVSEYDNPLNPIYAALSQQRLLTLRTIREHSELLHDHADQARDQTFAVHQVIQSCQSIPPTPLPILPLGF